MDKKELLQAPDGASALAVRCQYASLQGECGEAAVRGMVYCGRHAIRVRPCSTCDPMEIGGVAYHAPACPNHPDTLLREAAPALADALEALLDSFAIVEMDSNDVAAARAALRAAGRLP